MFIRVVHVCNIGVYIICIYIVIIYMYITVHTCINKCSWWVFDWHQPSQQWNCDTLYTTISWLYYNIYIYISVCVWCVCVPWFSQSGPQPLQGYKADVHAETPFGWSVLVYAALSDQVRGQVCQGNRIQPQNAGHFSGLVLYEFDLCWFDSSHTCQELGVCFSCFFQDPT